MECKGLGASEKKRVVRKLVTKYKPCIFFIQETKLSVLDSEVFHKLGGMVLPRGIGVESIGTAVGLISLWNEDLFSVKACISNNRCIILSGVLVKLNKEVVFCNVYAANNESERKELCDYILDSEAYFPIPWCISGDFNTVLDTSERRGGWGSRVSIRNFNSFILGAKVIDIPLRGIPFTWSNHRVEESWARLDWFLISPIMLSWFPNLSQRGLPGSISDHNVIRIEEPHVDWGT
ncbi:hypothetical protein Dsin_006844 [Dipteronia sinensis]|uniref:Endonuclease/exonuclease/phosphatase domain-containing protein n=1 Tax=Dipteronia sinensis TaxID=43782 RepID=A0AAE0AZG0_9ROSI|nr:hypothetical protein Dsin_006844 [Dipteronia sinensis]